MKKIVISLFLLVSVFSFAELREIQMIGVQGQKIPSKKIEREISSNIENKSENKSEKNIFSEAFENFLRGEKKEEDYVVGMREYRPQVLKNIDAQIATRGNRSKIKALNYEYDRELKNYLEQIAYNSDKIFFLANEYMMLNDYEKANKIFLLDNKDFKNIFGAATTYRFLGKNEEAVQKYTEAMSIDSSFAESYLGRALANRNLDNYESAVDDLKTYISMSGREEGYLALGDIYFKLDKKDEATNIVNQGLAKYPNSNLLKTLATNIYKN